MHYINGREAQDGDPVLYRSLYPQDAIGVSTAKVRGGVVHSIMPGSESCNGQCTYVGYGSNSTACVTLGKELMHAEDAWNSVIRDMQVPAQPIQENL